MGHRANLIIVHETGYQLYYCHWCANVLERELFWGADLTKSFIEQQEIADNDKGWLDTVWAEGGIVLDTNKSHLLFWGGEDINYEIELRHLYLDLMRYNWKGWTIQWAHGGILDMARYVDYPVEKVFQPKTHFNDVEFKNNSGTPKNSVGLIISIKDSNQDIRFWCLNRRFRIDDILTLDVDVVDKIFSISTDHILNLCNVEGMVLSSGLHFDLIEKTIYFWSCHTDKVSENFADKWAGWQFVSLGDDYQKHVELVDNKFKLPVTSYEDLLARLRDILLADNRGSMADFMQGIIKSIEDEYDVEGSAWVNPHAMTDNPQDIRLGYRIRVFNEVLTAWKRDNDYT